MHCPYYQSRICRSCSLLHLDYQQTLSHKRTALAELFPDVTIHSFCGADATGSRIRARLAITGTVDELLIGFYDDQHQLVPVDQCPLHHPLINEWTRWLPQIIRTAKLSPYDMQTDRGELKFVVLTCSPSHRQLMVQFVLRSREATDRIRSLWRRMTDAEKQAMPVMTINLQPTRSSAILGQEELPVSEQMILPIQFCGRELLFGPQSFLQTNYEIAEALYSTVRQILQDHAAENVLDLYCGVGAFSLIAGSAAKSVLGVDVSANAIECADQAAKRNGLSHVRFLCRSLDCVTVDHLPIDAPYVNNPTGDARGNRHFDTIICNPPRRGLDAASMALMQDLRPARILYSSCNARTLQRDLLRMSADYQIEFLQPFDMFPFTNHLEVLALMTRR